MCMYITIQKFRITFYLFLFMRDKIFFWKKLILLSSKD